jgi:hypothetical protein
LGSDEAINVNYGKKLKQGRDETFNAGKKIEAMKRLIIVIIIIVTIIIVILIIVIIIIVIIVIIM